jgi:hypothetical protein
MKLLATLLLLATLVSCAAPAPEPIDEAKVVDPGVVCRVGYEGRPAIAERGIGGTGAPARRQISDRGIGGTGIVGVVTGFASICVDGMEVRFDKTVPISVNGVSAAAGQLRVGQLVVIKASGEVTEPDQVARAQMISVRYEVSGPIEAVDSATGEMMVAGQRVMVLPSTWVGGHFGVGNWITVSGLRQSDGTIIASRLDDARAGALAVRGQISRDHDVTRIGTLVLQDPALATLKAGTFVSVVGRYRNGAAEVMSIESDRLLDDPTGFFGISTDRLIMQAFIRVESGMVWLSNGQKFHAKQGLQGKGHNYYNAIVWLERTADGEFTATALHYTSYRAQPKGAPPRTGSHGAGQLILPPDAPPDPSADDQPETDRPVVPALPGNAPTSNTVPLQAEPTADGAIIADQTSALQGGRMIVTINLAR